MKEIALFCDVAIVTRISKRGFDIIIAFDNWIPALRLTSSRTQVPDRIVPLPSIAEFESLESD